MNEDEEFIIEEDIDFDEEYSELEIKKNQYSFQQIKDICLTNPLYKRRYFRDNSENILNICYNCQNFQAINALLTRRSARRKYQFSYTLLMAIVIKHYEKFKMGQYSEEDVKLKFITPAIICKWDKMKQVTMEYSFTDGRVIVRGNLTSRGKPKRADYLLSLKANMPIAIVEAKDDSHSVGAGMQQAIRK